MDAPRVILDALSFPGLLRVLSVSPDFKTPVSVKSIGIQLVSTTFLDKEVGLNLLRLTITCLTHPTSLAFY